MKRLFSLLCAVVAFAACEQAPIEEQSAIRYEAPDTITVGFEGDDTRIQLNEAQKTVWTEGDQVSVFYKSYDNLKFEFEGNTGDRDGTLKRVGGQHNGQTMDDVVVVYPYSADYMITLSEGCVNATIPSTQTYLKGSYGVGDNLMIARSSFNQFSLKSVCGWLKIQLTGAGEVIERITFRGNNGEQVAGLVYVDATTAEATLATAKHNSDDNSQLDGTLVLDDSIYTEVILDCGEGVALGKEATAFYIALPPQTFEQGFTVEIEDTEGYVMEQSTDKALTIERNHIQPMAALEFVNPNSPAQPTPASNQIWYTSSDGDVVTPYNTNVFGATIISNEYNNGMGVITFDGVVTMIGNEAFRYRSSLTSMNIPDSVTEIGYGAFADCDSLTEFKCKYATEDGRSLIVDNTIIAYAYASGTTYTIPDSITEIGEYAFYDCDSLTSVNIPDSVTTIGGYAFRYCESLTSVNIPDSVTTIGEYAFYDCDSLTSVNIGDSVTTIGNYAFTGCTSLTSVTIGDSVTTIGAWVFCQCDSLTSVNIPDSVTEIGSSAFRYCDSLTSVTIPDSVTTIGHVAFEYCTSLKSVTIGDSVTSIGDYAFCSCDSLTEFKGKYATEDGRSLIVDNTIIAYANASGNTYTIPDSVTEIGWHAFYSCNSLTSVTIPDSVTTIGDYAFAGCESLTSVYCYATIPPSLYNSAFEFNASGRQIYVYDECVEVYKSAWSSYKDSIYPNGQNCPETTTIQYTTNDGNTITSSKLPIISNIYENGVGTLVIGGIITIIPNNAFRNCDSLTSVNIPDSVTEIGYQAFYDCDSLTSVNIPDSVTSIGSSAFYYCKSLTSVTIPDSVTSIGYYAFYYCTSLKSVNIPDSVTTIGYEAFYNCDSLTSVYCKATTPPALGDSYVFDINGSGRKIYVPAGSVYAYKSAYGWSRYASAIVGYDFENGVVVE